MRKISQKPKNPTYEIKTRSSLKANTLFSNAKTNLNTDNYSTTSKTSKLTGYSGDVDSSTNIAHSDLNKNINLYVIHEENLPPSDEKAKFINGCIEFINREDHDLFSPEFGNNTPFVDINSYEINSPKNYNCWSLNYSDPNINQNLNKVNKILEKIPQKEIPKQSPLNKIQKSSTAKQKNNLNLLPSDSSNYVDKQEILKDLSDLKEKFLLLEKELQILKNKKCHATTKKKNKEKNVGKSTKHRKQISDEDKLEMVNNINKLSITQKKEMREIIKDYITVYSDGQFQFNINCLSKEKFFELKKYLENCLKSPNNEKYSLKLNTAKESKVDRINKFL